MVFDSTDGAVSGEMAVDDTNMKLSPGTCPSADYNNGTDHFPSDSGSVSGTRDNLTGTAIHRNDYTGTNPPGGGVNAFDYKFVGHFDSDNQISGTLTVERTVTFRSTDGTINGTSRGSVTSPVTLRK
jgi:hypothetical protein